MQDKMQCNSPWAAWLIGLALLASASYSSAREGYYRWPALHQDTLVFASEGDLWRVASSGGDAMRLTTHPAEESQPAISPDGKMLAFVASYDSAAEVYLMPIAGGLPERISFDAARVSVQGFSPDGDLLYTTDAGFGPGWTRELRRYKLSRRSSERVALSHVTDAVFDASNTLWFTRFGLQLTGDNAQVYRGGAMSQLWQVNLASNTEASRRFADFNGNIRKLMLAPDQLFFISDQNGIDNLWQVAQAGGVPRTVTEHKDFAVRSASLSGEHIVYQLGADLHRLHWPSGRDQRLQINLSGDQDAQRARHHAKSLNYQTAAAIAPNGLRALLTVRGDLINVGAGAARHAVLPRTADSRYRNAIFSADASRVYAVADRDQGSAIVMLNADGSGKETELLASDRYIWQLQLSPDGQSIAFDDKGASLSLLNISQRSARELDRSIYGSDQPYESYRFSPDGKWLLAVRPDSALGREQLMLISVNGTAGVAPTALTSDRYISYSAEFSSDGHWLYFLSDRSWQGIPGGPWGDRNTGVLFDRRAKIYALALQANGPRFAFLPNDELNPASAHEAAPDSKAGAADKDAALPAIDPNGVAQRLFELPIAANNFAKLSVAEKRLYVLTYGAQTEAGSQLHSIAVGNLEPALKLLAEGIDDYALSANRKRLLVQKMRKQELPGELLLLDAEDTLPGSLGPHTVALSAWRLPVEPAREWQQMFDDAWRMQQQFLFDANMRGIDWRAVKTRVQPLLQRIGDRSELDDLLAQTIAPLSMLHSQIRPGELRADTEAATDSFLGADFAVDSGQPGLRIVTIWDSEFEQPSERGPLQAPGLSIRAGDRLLAVNGRPTDSLAALSTALLNQARQQTLLTLQRGDRRLQAVVTPVPIERESSLRYTHWVMHQRRAVDKDAKGQIAYLHLRAMGASDFAQFVRDFFAAIDRPALIIDVRSNRGGNIDSWIIEKLLRRSWAFWQPVNRQPYWNMQQSFRGHLVVLADQYTYSDGETLTLAVKTLKLGTVIGRRTAGAGVWLTGRNALVDGGTARAAEFGQFATNGQLVVEGIGVEPDIVVENPPHASANGSDAQRDAAVQFLLDKLQQEPIPAARTQPIPPLR